MAKTSATPDQISQALALREVGYTTLSISQRLGISVRSLNRHFAEHGTKKGAIKMELFEAARSDLMKRVTSDEAIREEAAKLINDDLAHARHLRELMIDATQHLQATSLKEASLVMRAAAAYSTAIKNTSDMMRQSLRLERRDDDADKSLPELVITELSDDQITELRKAQTKEDAQH